MSDRLERKIRAEALRHDAFLKQTRQQGDVAVSCSRILQSLDLE